MYQPQHLANPYTDNLAILLANINVLQPAILFWNYFVSGAGPCGWYDEFGLSYTDFIAIVIDKCFLSPKHKR